MKNTEQSDKSWSLDDNCPTSQTLGEGIDRSYEKDGFNGKRKMSYADFVKDINSEFGLKSFVSGKRGSSVDWDFGPGFVIPINQRGRSQVVCMIAHFRAWYYKGTTMNYCHHCPFFLQQTTLMDNGVTRQCRKGLWLQDAN